MAEIRQFLKVSVNEVLGRFDLELLRRSNDPAHYISLRVEVH